MTCITENVLDLPLPVCSPSNRDTVTFLDLNEDIQSVTLTREGQAGEFAEIVVEGTMFGCPDGAQSIFFSSILLNGEPYAFQYPREEKTNGLYGLDFYGNYLTMEGCDPTYSADSPYVVRWTFLAPLQEGTNTLSYDRQVYYGTIHSPRHKWI